MGGRTEVFKSFRTWTAFGIVALLCVLAALPSSAQQAGTILGVVKDSSGGVVPNAKVFVTNVDTSAARSVTSGDDGAYRVPGLQPGRYSVKVEAQGFQTENVTGLILDVAEELVSNVTVQVGTSTQEVTVTGEAPVINTTTSSLGNLINDQTISELPLNGRNYTDLTLLSPGISVATHSGLGDAGLWYSSNGAPPRSNNYTLDGAITVTKNGTGPASMTGSTLGVDGIKEYKVVTSMFSAEYGLLMGSQMVIVSKGGTNQWHGTSFEYLRNNHLDARNFFDPQPDVTNHILTNAAGNPERLPQFKRSNFGASVGGPIQKDKTFFFLTYEGLRVAQGDTIQNATMPAGCHFANNSVLGNVILGGGPLSTIATAALPAGFTAANQMILQGPLPGKTTLAAACGLPGQTGTNVAASGTTIAPLVQAWIGQFPFPNETIPGSPNNNTFNGFSHARDDYAQLRVDRNFGANNTFFARYTMDDGLIHTPYLGGNLSLADTGTAYQQYTNIGRSRNQYITLGENHIFTPTLLNSFRLSFSRMIYINSFSESNTAMNPNFFLHDSTSTCFYGAPVGGCVWSFVPGFFTGGFSPGSGMTALTPPGTFPNYHYNNVWSLPDDVFYTHGKHAFKFGTLLTRMNQPHLQSKSIYGAITFGNIQNFYGGLAQNFNVVGPGTGVGNPSCVATLPCVTLNPQFGNAGYLDRDHTWYTIGLYAQDDYRVTSRVTLNLGLRYEFMTHISEMFNRQSTVPDIRTSPNPVLVPNGIWQNSTFTNISPRLGVAWDVFGTGKTAVRSGFGIYYDVGNIGALLTQNSTGVLPFVANTTFQAAAPVAITLPLCPSCAPYNAAAGRSLQMGDYQDKSPHSLQYNVTVEQQLPKGVGLAVSYVGRRGLNLYTGMEGNPVIPQAFVNDYPQYNVGVAPVPGNPGSGGLAGCFNSVTPVDANGVPTGTPPAVAPCRVNPYFGSALFFTNASSSWYNALQVNVTKQLSRGLMFQGAYTWSRSTDTSEGTRFNDDCGGPAQANFGHDPFNVAKDYGPSCFDIPNSAHFNVIYHLPGITSKGFLSKITNGWGVTNLVSIQQGNPFAPIVTNDRSFSGIVSQNPSSLATLNAASTPGVGAGGFIPYDPKTVITGNPNQWFNPFMFGVPSLGLQGNSPRGILRDPGLGTWDFSIVKDTKLGLLGEAGNVEFRAEFFNMLNRANFGFETNMAVFNAATTKPSDCPGGKAATPGCDVSNGTTLAPLVPLSNAGQISNTNGTSRQIQLALRVSF